MGQAGAFALLLLCILLSPALLGKRNLPPRDRIYSSYSSRLGAYSYLHQQIFEEKGDIDIAFVGSSRIWLDINTPEVQEKLSQQLGRRAVARTLGWSKPGFDALYFVAQDLLQRRKVRLLVFYDEVNPRASPNLPHRLAFRWFRFGDNRAALDGLSIRDKASYYAAAVLGCREIFSILRDRIVRKINAPPSEPGRVSITWRRIRRTGSGVPLLTWSITNCNLLPTTSLTPRRSRPMFAFTRRQRKTSLRFRDQPPRSCNSISRVNLASLQGSTELKSFSSASLG